jgi:aspartate/methionine/tyrosine aminotransferase
MNNVRILIKERLSSLDRVELVDTKGSFYFLLKLHTTKSSIDIAKRLIEEHSVITIPGEVFGACFPSLRISYGNLTMDRAKEALDRLEAGLSVLLD